MANEGGQQITPQMILLGRGLRTLAPTRRLLLDAVGVIFAVVVLIVIAVVLDFERAYAVGYISVFGVIQVVIALLRYLRART